MANYPAVRNAIGFLTKGGGSATVSINATNAWLMFGFAAPDDTFTDFLVYASDLVGTPAAADVTATLYACDSEGSPSGGAVAGPVNCDSTPAIGWLSWSGFSYACTPGIQYAVVLKNLHGTPASNYIKVTYATTTIPLYITSTIQIGYTKKLSTDGGSTWGSVAVGVAGPRFGFTSTKRGLPFNSISNGAVGYGVYSAREFGSRFTSQANGILRVRGLCVCMGAKSGSPTGNKRLRLYEGTTWKRDTYDILAVVTNQDLLMGTFSSVYEMAPNTLHRITLGETTQSDSSSNRYNATFYTIHNDAASRSMMSFGDMHATYLNGTFADTTTDIVPVGLILDDGAGEFAPYGMKFHPGMNGNFNG